MSLDIDIIGNRDGLTMILQEQGFKSFDGRNWHLEELDIHVDIQGGSINIPGGDGRVADVEVPGGFVVKMVSLTDIVVDRISAYASGHKDSGTQAAAILSAWRNHIDLDVLRDVCGQESASAECEEVIKLSWQQEHELPVSDLAQGWEQFRVEYVRWWKFDGSPAQDDEVVKAIKADWMAAADKPTFEKDLIERYKAGELRTLTNGRSRGHR
jgi:hypothetical protein